MSPLEARPHLRGVSLFSVAIAATTMLASGCAASEDASSGSSGGAGKATQIIVAYSQPLNTLDPIRSDQNQTNSIVDSLYDTLLAYDAQSNLVPSVASSYKLAADSKSVDITLRSDVKFHDGTTLKAQDVAYTLDRYKKIGQGIASGLATYDSTTVTDDTHLTIKLKSAYAQFPAWLTKFYLLEKKLVEQNAGSDNGQTWLHDHDAGSGPFAVQQGTNPVNVKRFADYWQFDDKRPSSIVFRQIAESPTKRDELKAGNLDIALTLQAPDAKALETTQGVKVDYLKVPNTAYMYMNVVKGPTANPTVRKALALAYNYGQGLSDIRAGKGTIENGPLPQTMPCGLDSAPFAQNLDEAKSLLAQAGLGNLRLTLRFQPSITDQVREATMFQSDLKKIGVTLNLQPIAFPDYLASLSKVDTIPQLVLLQDTAPMPDPGVFLIKSFDSSTIGSTNRAGYKNAKVDELLAKSEATSDDQARCELYKQAEQQINADVPAISMYTLDAPVAYSDRISGVVGSQTVYPLSVRGVRVR